MISSKHNNVQKVKAVITKCHVEFYIHQTLKIIHYENVILLNDVTYDIC